MSIARLALDYDDAAAEPAWSPPLRRPIVSLVAKAGEANYRRLLGAAIVQLRGLRLMSQADLAEAIDRSEAAVSRWETGKATPTAWDLREIARVCSLEDDQLDLLLRPPRGPVSPIAARLARASEAGASAGRASGARRREGGSGA